MSDERQTAPLSIDDALAAVAIQTAETTNSTAQQIAVLTGTDAAAETAAQSASGALVDADCTQIAARAADDAVAYQASGAAAADYGSATAPVAVACPASALDAGSDTVAAQQSVDGSADGGASVSCGTFDFDGTLASADAAGIAETAAPYSFENPPPITNYPLYWWHIIAKILSFALFGVGAVLISIVAFPIMMLFFPSRQRFRKAGHRFISVMFRFFTLFMTVIGASRITAKERKEFKQLRSCIVVANHPSLLDVVMLISLLPDADCIVNAYLAKKNILHIIARKLYIPAADSYEEIIAKSVESLRNGSVLIIFPEGTRSKPSGQNPYKKGAARVALASGCPIVPVYIGGNDKRGLRKHDSMFKYNTRHCYHYDIHKKPSVLPADYRDLPEPAAAKRMTARLREILSDDANREYITIYGNDRKS